MAVVVRVDPRHRPLRVLRHVHGGEVHVAVHGRALLRDLRAEREVVAQLGRVREHPRRHLVQGLPDVQVRARLRGHAGPPRHELRVVGDGEPELPVDLRVDVVEPARQHPLPGVGELQVVALRAARVRAARVGRRVAPDAERADAELDPRLERLDPLGDRPDELVDVVPPPVLDRREARAVLRVGGGVGQRLAGHGVGVEVVVEVHAVDVVVLHAVQDRRVDVLAGLRQARVEVELAAVGPHPVGVLPRGVGGQELRRVRLHRDAVRVVPGVQLEVACVRLRHDEGERVEARVAALRAGEVLRPRLVGAGPERVGRRPHLDEDGVEVHARGHVEPVHVLGPQLVRAQPRARGPVDVDDGRDPHRAQLPLAGGGAGGGRRRARRRGRCGGCHRADGHGQRRAGDPGGREGEEAAASEGSVGGGFCRDGMRHCRPPRIRRVREFHARWYL